MPLIFTSFNQLKAAKNRYVIFTVHKTLQKHTKPHGFAKSNSVDYARKLRYTLSMNYAQSQAAATAPTESLELVKDKTFRFTAEKLVLACGVRADLKGFNCLVDAIILYGTEFSTSFCEIYNEIAIIRNLKPKTVMREISYAITQSFCLHERLSELMGIPISQADIHNGLVIAYLSNLFKHPPKS